MLSDNSFYERAKTKHNIYEFLYLNDFKQVPATIYIILESVWIIELLFKDSIIERYDKKYEISKKITSHITICNKKKNPEIKLIINNEKIILNKKNKKKEN
jgi:hypothetical protein